MTYRGVSDDPEKYELRSDLAHLRLYDDGMRTTRDARDHRDLALEQFRRRGFSASPAESESTSAAPAVSATRVQDAPPEAQRVLRAARQKKHHDVARAKPLLKAFLRTVAHLDPVSSAVLAFTEGLTSIHHIYHVERLVRDVSSDEDTRKILDEIHDSVDQLSPERARDLIDVLVALYGA